MVYHKLNIRSLINKNPSDFTAPESVNHHYTQENLLHKSLSKVYCEVNTHMGSEFRNFNSGLHQKCSLVVSQFNGVFTLSDTENENDSDNENDNYGFHYNMQSTSHCTETDNNTDYYSVLYSCYQSRYRSRPRCRSV